MPSRTPLAVLLLTGVLLTSGCEGDSKTPDDSARNPATAEPSRLEPTTARGLAAGVTTHLDGSKITWIGGTETQGTAGGRRAVSVAVEFTHPSIESIHVDVQALDPDVAPTQCGRDFGYRTVTCQTDPYMEVLRRKEIGTRAPVLIGYYYDEARGWISVLT